MSLRTAWFIAFEDLRHLLRHREVLLWAFVMPSVFMLFFGAMSSAVHPRRSGKIHFVVEGQADDPVADQLMSRLRQLGIELVDAADDTRVPKRVLRLPPDFGRRVSDGRDLELGLELTGDGLTASQDLFCVRAATGLVCSDVARLEARGEPATAAAFASLAASSPLALEVTSPSGRADGAPGGVVPFGFRHAAPGVLLTLTLVTFLTSGAALLVGERREGLLVRFVCPPVSRWTVVVGKGGGRFLLGVAQLGLGVLAASLLVPGSAEDGGRFIPSGAALVAVVLVFVAFAALCTAGALLLGSLARTEAQSLTIGALVANALAALGGCWFPIGLAPPWMVHLSNCLPTGWAIDAIHRVTDPSAALVAGSSPIVALASSVAGEVGALIALAAVIFALAARAFRFR